MYQETDFLIWLQEKRWFLPAHWCKAQCREFYEKTIKTKGQHDPLDIASARFRSSGSNTF